MHPTPEDVASCRRGEKDALPWWTWIAPLLACNVGTWLSLWSQTAPGAAVWYFPTAMGAVMALWWGPRVLLGVFLNAMFCASLWSLPWEFSPLYALPETLQVAMCWLLFDRWAKSSCRLPDLSSLIRFLLFGAGIPIAVSNVYLVLQLVLLGDLGEGDGLFLVATTNYFTLLAGDLTTYLTLAAPVLVLATPTMQQRGWVCSECRAAPDHLFPEHARRPLDFVLLGCFFGVALFVAAVLPLPYQALLFGILVATVSMWFGMPIATIAVAWIAVMAVAVPEVLDAVNHTMSRNDAVVIQARISALLLSLFGLLVGRTSGDRMREFRERQEAVEQLSKSEERLRVALAAAQMGTWRWDPATDLDTRDASLNRLLGLDAVESTQNVADFFDRIHPEDREAAGAEFDRAIREHDTYLAEFRIVQPDDAVRWVRDQGRSFHDKDGALLYVTGALVDITERKRIETELERHREHLEELVQQRTEDLQRKTEALGKAMTELEAAQSQLIQSEKMALLGQLASGIAHEVNNPLGAIASTAESMRHAIERFLQDIELLATQFGGSRRALLIDALTAASRTSDLHLSTRRRRELRVELEEKLTRAGVTDARSGAEFLIDLGIDEEFERFTPLLQLENGTRLVERVRDLSRVSRGSRLIETATNQAAKIVFALKNYAHTSESGAWTAFDLRENITSVLTLYSNKMKDRVEVEIDSDDSIRITAIADQLCQVWTNLIHNALQAMDFQGTLALSIRSDDGDAVVRITDTGGGIPQEHVDRVFDPFFTTKNPGEGCGLGLDIVRRIVERHHGRVEFESTEGVGTTVIVRLPLEPPRTVESN